MTLRGIEALKEADIIACEDTRNTINLLRHFEIRKKLVSYHEHNEIVRTSYLIGLMEEGKSIALVSDAGTPGISDPGYVIIKAAIEEGIPVDILPGANAIIPALLSSGFPPHPFTFIGFLPDKKGERLKYLESFKSLKWPLVFYLSPHKAEKHLDDLITVLGNRKCAMSREITKIYQETIRCPLSELLLQFQTKNIKGELVLVVYGSDEPGSVDEGKWREEAMELLRSGSSVRDITTDIAEKFEVPRNLIKKFIIENKKQEHKA
jgi:16S rRNA (cytidine1402-2'-O)-methyltransferase